MKWLMVAVYTLAGVLNSIVAALWFVEGSEGFGIMWSVAAGLWFGGAIIWGTIAREG